MVDEEAADQVWELWDASVIDDEMAAREWLLLAKADVPLLFFPKIFRKRLF